MRNTLPAVSQGRQPRSIVKVAGQPIPFVSWQVDNNSFFAADTFRVLFPISTLPSGYGTDWWFSQEQIDIEAMVGFPADPANPQPSELTSLIYGRIDELTLELTDTAIEVSGRDLTSVLIDTKTSEKYQDMKASDVATKLAGSHGLAAAITTTQTKIGTYYNSAHVRLQDERSEWDLLTWLAREEGFIVYVQGQSLHFEPQPSESQDPYVFQWVAGNVNQINATTARVSRNLTLAKDVRVEVHSWNSKTGKAVTGTAQAQHTRNRVTRKLPIAVNGDAQVYSFNRPNMTKDEADARALQLLKEISRHEMRLEIEGPADNILSRTDVIQLQGTNTGADQTYYIDSLTRSFSADEGYAWRIEAKNHSPQTEVTL